MLSSCRSEASRFHLVVAVWFHHNCGALRSEASPLAVWLLAPREPLPTIFQKALSARVWVRYHNRPPPTQAAATEQNSRLPGDNIWRLSECTSWCCAPFPF